MPSIPEKQQVKRTLPWLFPSDRFGSSASRRCLNGHEKGTFKQRMECLFFAAYPIKLSSRERQSWQKGRETEVQERRNLPKPLGKVFGRTRFAGTHAVLLPGSIADFVRKEMSRERLMARFLNRYSCPSQITP
jgi:hypothetical protein